VICDPETRITKYCPGSTHDSRIFRNSAVKDMLENIRHLGHLIGDSGYPCTRYLLIRVVREQTEAEKRYNIARSVVERTFGTWKKRFPCLQFTLRIKLETTQLIILATQRREPEFQDNFDEEDVNENMREDPDRVGGINWRNIFIRNHFQR
ncbi:hypothetical protein L9F63_026056, partial [Diploptera punctata]